MQLAQGIRATPNVLSALIAGPTLTGRFQIGKVLNIGKHRTGAVAISIKMTRKMNDGMKGLARRGPRQGFRLHNVSNR